MLRNLSDIQHAFYINLEYRTDRLDEIESELFIMGINAQRFNAISTTNGAIGCTMSHLKLLNDAINNNYSHLLILEDDVQFLEPELFKTKINKFLELHENNWDVIIFSGNNVPPHIQVDETCIKVTRCQTTTGYLVNGHYLKKLRDNVKEGLEKLIKNPQNHYFFAIDKYWFNLQQFDNWYLIVPMTVVQREGYSDIEKRVTNYKNVMTDIDKLWLKLPPSALM
jgi:glycosyl transferase family 25